MMSVLMIMVFSCTPYFGPYPSDKECKTISTRVTRYDKEHGIYRTVGYDYTRVCN